MFKSFGFFVVFKKWGRVVYLRKRLLPVYIIGDIIDVMLIVKYKLF